jgi:hypothetical protein
MGGFTPSLCTHDLETFAMRPERKKPMKTSLCFAPLRSTQRLLITALAACAVAAGCSDDKATTSLADAAVPSPIADAATTTKDAPVTVDAPSTTKDAPVANDVATDEVASSDAGFAADSSSADSGDAMADTIAVAGTWLSNFGGTETITDQRWSDAIVVEFDNANHVAFTQNPLTATYGPGKFNKLVWTPIAGASFYYCFVDFSLESLAAAKATTKVADASNPDKSGCGGFSWTKLTKL